MASNYPMIVLTQTPDQAGISREIFIYNSTLSWGKIIKTCFIEKRAREFSLIPEIPTSIVKFSINELLFSVITSLLLVGLVTGASLEALPIFSPNGIYKTFENVPKIAFSHCNKNSPFNLKMIINRNRSL